MTRVGFAHEFQNFEGQAELSVMKVGVELSLSQQRFSRERLGKKEASGGQMAKRLPPLFSPYLQT